MLSPTTLFHEVAVISRISCLFFYADDDNAMITSPAHVYMIYMIIDELDLYISLGFIR